MLVLFTVARAFGLLGPTVVAVGLLTGALAVIARTTGATRADLGLGRADMLAGLRYGTGALAVVLLVLVVAAAVPATSGFLHDSRAEIGGGRLLYELGVSIVALTAVPEEFAFRGVLLGSALGLRAPPDDRVGRVHQVQDPAAVPRPARRRDSRRRVIREPHDPPVLLDLRAASVAVVAELAVQRVETWLPGEQGAGRPVTQVVFAAEGRLTAE